jgi:hypothetical protein
MRDFHSLYFRDRALRDVFAAIATGLTVLMSPNGCAPKTRNSILVNHRAQITAGARRKTDTGWSGLVDRFLARFWQGLARVIAGQGWHIGLDGFTVVGPHVTKH